METNYVNACAIFEAQPSFSTAAFAQSHRCASGGRLQNYRRLRRLQKQKMAAELVTLVEPTTIAGAAMLADDELLDCRRNNTNVSSRRKYT